MSDDPFERPTGSGDVVEWTERVGQLALVEPKSIEPEIPTANGVADALQSDVTFIDAPGDGPEEFSDVLIFSRVIFSKCKGHLGKMVLGRVTPYTSKAGRDTVDLAPPTDADVELGKKWLEARKAKKNTNPFSQPAQQAEPPF